jgi:hypothetical protein
MNGLCPAAQPAHAPDRFAREILAILAGIVVRLRRLMGRPLGMSSTGVEKRYASNSGHGQNSI